MIETELAVKLDGPEDRCKCYDYKPKKNLLVHAAKATKKFTVKKENNFIVFYVLGCTWSW